MPEFPALYRALASQFGDADDRDEYLSLDDVRRYVAGKVAALLDANPGLLMSILYRIDVAETAVQRAFRDEPPEMLPNRIAVLIVERQLEKLDTKKRYRNKDLI